jgi:hypothetical protein
LSAKGGTKVTGRGSAGLPPRLLDCIRRFGDEGWRERKQAVEEVLMVLATEQPDGPTFAALIDTLIDGVIDPLESAIYEGRGHEQKVVAGGGVSARAACQDVLIQLGRASLPKVLQRLDPEDTRSSGTRLMVDMIGQIGGEPEIPILTKFLRDTNADENLRASSAASLGEIGGVRAIEALEQLLGDDSEMLQLYALDALRAASAAVPVERGAARRDRSARGRRAVVADARRRHAWGSGRGDRGHRTPAGRARRSRARACGRRRGRRHRRRHQGQGPRADRPS